MPYLTVDSTELPCGVTKCDDLGGADECEIKRVKKENQVLSTVVVKTDLLKLAVDGCLTFEKRSFLLQLWIRHLPTPVCKKRRQM